MQRMPNISLSQQELCTRLRNSQAFGGESIISAGTMPNTVDKIFIDYTQTSHHLDGNAEISGVTDMLDNKFYKIERLYHQQPDYSVQPTATISYEGRLIGYEMTCDMQDITLSKVANHLSRSELIYYLENAKKILQYYARRDITYGDVASRNILINRQNGTAKFCDMDNIRLGVYPIDLLPTDLERYSYYRDIDASADAYMHNILTLRQFADSSTGEKIIRQLEAGKCPKGFKNTAKKTLQSMIDPSKFNGEYIIQYIKK